jgi:hypothetical protein
LLQNGDTITLSFNGSRWKVNDTWYADRDMIDVLFATLQQASPKRPVSKAQQDSLVDMLQRHGVKVELYSKGITVGSILAGGNASKTQAYFCKPEDKKVYLVNIPGYRVYVSGIFELNESGWREKRVFAFNWQNFQQLEAHFPQNPKQDFKVVMKDMQVGIPGVAAPDTARLNDFLDAVSLLTVDEYLDSSPLLDSLLSVEPIQILTVSDISNRNFTLKLYPSANQAVTGQINATQWADFEGRKIRRILVPKDFFVRH